MKITDVKVWLVQGIKYNWTLLKIYTDEGYTGCLLYTFPSPRD